MTKPKLKINHASGTVQRGFTGSEVSQWLALRAGVLRRAVSHSGTALMRGARRGKRWLKVELYLRSIVLEHRTSNSRRELTGKEPYVPPKTSVARSPISRSNQLLSRLVFGSGFKRRWLTNRSTGQFAAQVNWASFHSRPIAPRRKLPVSSNVMRCHFALSFWSPLRLPSGLGTTAVLPSFTSAASLIRHLSLKRFYRGHVSLPSHESFRAPPGHRLPGAPAGSRSAPWFVPPHRADLRATHNE